MTSPSRIRLAPNSRELSSGCRWRAEMRAGTPPRARRGPTAAHARRGSRPVVPIAAERGVLTEPVHLGGHVRRFLLEVIGDRGAQPYVADPVHAHRLGRVEAAQLLELTARPWLEPPESPGDAVRDGGVVADVEVEVAERLERAPGAGGGTARLLQRERGRGGTGPAGRHADTQGDC